jgi:hypothetical protein
MNNQHDTSDRMRIEENRPASWATNNAGRVIDNGVTILIEPLITYVACAILNEFFVISKANDRSRHVILISR